MKTFIALVTVHFSFYMDKGKERQEIHLVEAEDEESAVEKLEKHYKAKDKDYQVSHRVEVDSINEKI